MNKWSWYQIDTQYKHLCCHKYKQWTWLVTTIRGNSEFRLVKKDMYHNTLMLINDSAFWSASFKSLWTSKQKSIWECCLSYSHGKGILSMSKGCEYIQLLSSSKVCHTVSSPAVCLAQMFSNKCPTPLHSTAAFIPRTSCHKHFLLFSPWAVMVGLANAWATVAQRYMIAQLSVYGKLYGFFV